MESRRSSRRARTAPVPRTASPRAAAAGADPAGLNKPADVVAATFDALPAGEDEVLTDELAWRVHAAPSRPVATLYPALASR